VSVWSDVIGQESAVATLAHAVRTPGAMTHAWLFTGPPGSGRSVAARAFAAALLCPDGGCGECRECRTALGGTHADVDVIATEGLSIKVEQARDLVALAAHRPSVGNFRVIIVEDADRLTERAADALLKALEEPAPRTVWMLCAPSVEDVIITIRSRSRHVRLRTPPVESVAALLTRRDGVDPSMALYAARAAQSHVGMAARLARDEHARIRRHDVITLATRIVSVGDAIGAPPIAGRCEHHRRFGTYRHSRIHRSTCSWVCRCRRDGGILCVDEYDQPRARESWNHIVSPDDCFRIIRNTRRRNGPDGCTASSAL